jgi:hypothetical protein
VGVLLAEIDSVSVAQRHVYSQMEPSQRMRLVHGCKSLAAARPALFGVGVVLAQKLDPRRSTGQTWIADRRSLRRHAGRQIPSAFLKRPCSSTTSARFWRTPALRAGLARGELQVAFGRAQVSLHQVGHAGIAYHGSIVGSEVTSALQ